MSTELTQTGNSALNRRSFLAAGALSAVAVAGRVQAAEADSPRIVTPPSGKRLLLACKLSMITKDVGR